MQTGNTNYVFPAKPTSMTYFMSTVQYYEFECVTYFQSSIYTVLLSKDALAYQLATNSPT